VDDSSEWMLERILFKKICQKLGYPRINLFHLGYQTNFQTIMLESWTLTAWEGMHSMDWDPDLNCAFPLFCTIGRVLAKVQREGASLIIITLAWQAQPWFSKLLEMSIKNPVLLPKSQVYWQIRKGINTHWW
jgi:hypothetical protein